MAKKCAAAKQEPKSAPVVNEGNKPDATRAVAGRNGGTLHPHAPGSNGGVHRGPDLQPRNLIRSIALKAMIDVGELPGPEKRSGAQRRKRATARDAMIHNAAKGFQNIALRAACNELEAFGPFLRMMFGIHEVLQPTPTANGKHGGNGGGPIMPRFSPPLGSLPAPAVEAPAPEPPRGVARRAESPPGTSGTESGDRKRTPDTR